jgi:hypothetical protein
MSSNPNEMLIACRDGFLNDGGKLVEVKAGVTRIAPEVLAERPQYGDFFERSFSAPGTDSLRVRSRVSLPGGTVLAD